MQFHGDFMTNSDKIINQALELSLDERVHVIDTLLASLEGIDEQNEILCVNEVEDRLDAFDKGEMKALPVEEVLRKYR